MSITPTEIAAPLGISQTLPHDMPLDLAERATWPALRNGWRCKCPNCGTGPIMRGYLTVRDACPVCGEDLHHQRADDGPAYLTILIVGHLMAPLLMAVFTHFRPEPATLIAIFSVFTVVLSLYLLPRIKGALVALQWAKRMHGFGGQQDFSSTTDA